MGKKFGILIIAFSLGLFAGQSYAATYNFEVLYAGAGNASLNLGSDNPIGTNILPGDSFFWSIEAQANYFWNVVSDASLFPMAAFHVIETGNRVGDFTFTLSNNGTVVFTTTETDAINSYVHLGTNTIHLSAGLEFDKITLNYSLTSAIEDPQYAVDPSNLLPIDSTINGLLPIFGTPEINPYSPNGSIIFTTGAPFPEPATMLLFGTGIAGLAAVGRRKRS